MKKLLFALLFICTSVSAQEYGIVKNVRNNYRLINTPIEDCRDVSKRPSTRLNAGTVIGGVAGGIIGNQIGNGGVNAAATAIGAGVGAIVGQDLGNRGNYENKQVCTTTYRQRHEIENYTVAVNYKGTIISSVLNYRPIIGSQVPVTIIIGE